MFFASFNILVNKIKQERMLSALQLVSRGTHVNPWFTQAQHTSQTICIELEILILKEDSSHFYSF